MGDFIKPPDNATELFRYRQNLCKIINWLFVYGEMYATNISQTVTVSVADTAYELTAGLTEGITKFTTFGSNHYLSVNYAGKYIVNWSLSIDTAGAGDEIEGGLMVNDVAQTKSTAHTTVGNANKASTVSATAILSLNKDDQVSLFVRNSTNTNNIVVEHASLTIKRIDS